VPGKDPRLDPAWAATHFFEGSPGHRGALAYDKRGSDARGRPIRTAGDLAQATQVSAYPDRYDEREDDARALLRRLGERQRGSNPYSPEQICGPGFKVIDHADLNGRGTVYLLWRGSSQENCVVTLKIADAGRPTATEALLQPRGQQEEADGGQYQYYAGPVTSTAPGCIRWGGALSDDNYLSPWEHCGSSKEQAQVIGTVNTSGAYLTVRSGPGTGHRPLGAVADGATVTILCQARGTVIEGTYGASRLWDKIGEGRFVSDAYVFSGSDKRVAPDC
jgi:hypothetical protein